MKRFLFVLLSIVLSASGIAQPVFTDPVAIGEGTGKYRLSRNPRGSMALDSERTLHVTYWRGGFYTSPSTPSRVLYRFWNPAEGWSGEWAVDDSYVQEGPEAGTFIGGRQPNLAITDDDTVWIVWHDHRHCQGNPGAWIDNVEIYADYRVKNGNFTPTDVRITRTNAQNNGDNGYMPRIAQGPDGRLHVIWYDYHRTGGFPDIYLKSSDLDHKWDLSESMQDMQLTSYQNHPDANPFILPDSAMDPLGRLHYVFTSSFNNADGGLFYGSVSPEGVSEGFGLLRQKATSFWDPPRAKLDPQGNFWAVWADKNNDALREELYCARKPLGSGTFDPPIRLTNSFHREWMPDMEVDEDGRLHLVWVDTRNGTHVYYGLFDPMGNQNVSLEPSSAKANRSDGLTHEWTLSQEWNRRPAGSDRRDACPTSDRSVGFSRPVPDTSLRAWPEWADFPIFNPLQLPLFKGEDRPEPPLARRGGTMVSRGPMSRGNLDTLPQNTPPVKTGVWVRPAEAGPPLPRSASADPFQTCPLGRGSFFAGPSYQVGPAGPTSGTMLYEIRLTSESANWATPTILRDGRGDLYILYEKDVDGSSGSVYFITTRTHDASCAIMHLF